MATGPHGEVRLAELLSALSLAIDLGMGQPPEHVLRTVLLAVELARELGLDEGTVSDVYYTTLIRLVGCTADAHQTDRLAAGDDIGFRARAAVHTMGGEDEIAALVRATATGGRRPASFVAAVRQEALAAHCEVGGLLAQQLAMPPRVCHAVRCGFASWDGQGIPAGIAGSDIPLAARIAIVARDVELVMRSAGFDAAVDLARRRNGIAYDPQVVRALVKRRKGLLREEQEVDVWNAVLGAEPGPPRTVGDHRIEELLEAFGRFADLKSPFTVGHSAGVAARAVGAGRLLGLRRAEIEALAQAGHVHDLGRVGVANGIWDKRGRLTTLEWERVRLHPYLTERILDRSPALRHLARLAGAHPERLDGSGYVRGSRARDQPLAERILAAADACHAMTELRAHRPPLTPAQAARQLRAEVGGGRLDPEACDAVVHAAGAPSRHRRDSTGLTPRELDVLRLICRGVSNRLVAARLGISSKTVGHHVEHIYGKLRVSTRAAATLVAVQRGLLEP